jgi:hypothetical protein
VENSGSRIIYREISEVGRGRLEKGRKEEMKRKPSPANNKRNTDNEREVHNYFSSVYELYLFFDSEIHELKNSSRA